MGLRERRRRRRRRRARSPFAAFAPEIDTKRCVFNELTKKEKACLPHKPKKNRERERKSGRKRKGNGVRSPAARGGCDVRQRGAIIVSGFHRAMITLTAEMAHNKRTFGYTKVRCRVGGLLWFWDERGRRKKLKTETETQKQKQEEKKMVADKLICNFRSLNTLH